MTATYEAAKDAGSAHMVMTMKGKAATSAEGDVSYEGDGLLARCLQHEADHIQGTVFGDRLSDRARKKLRKEMEAAAADYPEEWPVGEEVEAPDRDRLADGVTGPEVGDEDVVR